MPTPNPRKSKLTVNPTLLGALIVAVIAASGFWYWLGRSGAPAAPEVIPPPESFDSALLTDPRFQNLTLPKGLPLPDVKLGRPNPFAIIESATGTPSAPTSTL